MKQSLQRYGHIMTADDHYTRWQEVTQSNVHKILTKPTLLPFFLKIIQMQQA